MARFSLWVTNEIISFKITREMVFSTLFQIKQNLMDMESKKGIFRFWSILKTIISWINKKLIIASKLSKWTLFNFESAHKLVTSRNVQILIWKNIYICIYSKGILIFNTHTFSDNLSFEYVFKSTWGFQNHFKIRS